MNRRKVIIEWIKQVLEKHITCDKTTFIFGSQANLKKMLISDFDIGYESKNDVSHHTFLMIKRDLEELPTLYSFDLVDFSKVDSNFKKIATQNIELI